jgi:hypothetical protein
MSLPPSFLSIHFNSACQFEGSLFVYFLIHSSHPNLQNKSLTNLGGNQLKASQGGKASNGFVRQNGCLAVEPQDLIDGINHPEWNRTAYQISGPGTAPFSSHIQYKFSTI